MAEQEKKQSSSNKLKELELEALIQNEKNKVINEERKFLVDQTQKDNALKKYLINIWKNLTPKEINPGTGVRWVLGATRYLATRLLQDNYINSIVLNRRNISDDEAACIFEALKTNTTVRKVQMDGNMLGSKTLEALTGLLKTNTSLQFISLECNFLFTDVSMTQFEDFTTALKLNETL